MTTMVDLLLIVVSMAGVPLVVLACARGWGKGGARGFGALTSSHDFQLRDRQHAIEIVIEKEAGKRGRRTHLGA